MNAKKKALLSLKRVNGYEIPKASDEDLKKFRDDVKRLWVEARRKES